MAIEAHSEIRDGKANLKPIIGYHSITATCDHIEKAAIANCLNEKTTTWISVYQNKSASDVTV